MSNMRRSPTILVSAGLAFTCALTLSVTTVRNTQASSFRSASLCTKAEKVVFSCLVRRSLKIVSLCSSRTLTKTSGYLQYRFGLSGKVELEFPKDRSRSLSVFKYSHYHRALVDYTEISFSVDGYTYSISDDYNEEEKPIDSEESLTVTNEGTKKEVKFLCRGPATADYGDLEEVLDNEWPGN